MIANNTPASAAITPKAFHNLSGSTKVNAISEPTKMSIAIETVCKASALVFIANPFKIFWKPLRTPPNCLRISPIPSNGPDIISKISDTFLTV